MYYPLKSFDLVFDYALSENKINRWRPGEEGKRRKGLSRSRCNKCLYG
jgi:hypothetical protein